MCKNVSAARLLTLAREPPARATIRALVFLIELEVFAWLRKQNYKGVVPRRPDLIAEAAASAPMGLPGKAADKLNQRQPDFGQAASLRARRNCVTLLATICSDPSLAPLLPQIVLANERHISGRLEAAVAADLELTPANNSFLFRRRKSAWVNADTMVQYLDVLCANLKHVLSERLCALFLDACSAHLRSKKLETARARGLRLIVIPALCTSWLQPL
eukprot:Skav233079  [mRNA]  locus=scaffold1468:321343:322471:- [translate_table: standard]